MIDCSHGNSEKKHERQISVAEDVAKQLASLETAHNILGVMIESNLVEGKQSIPVEGPTFLKYGQSITDACISWTATIGVLDRLREGVQARRKLRKFHANGYSNGPTVHIPISNSDFNHLNSLPSLASR